MIQQFSIPMNFRSNKEKGAIELVRLGSAEMGEKTAGLIRLLRITDIGISYKISEDSLLLWVTSLNLGTPLKNISVLAFLKGASFALLGKTDENGVLLIKDLETRPIFSSRGSLKSESSYLSLRDIEFIVVSSPSDRSFIALRTDTSIKPDWIVQSKAIGEKQFIIKGHVFTERGIYRPGEKAFFKGTIREYRDGVIASPSGLKPRFLILNSKNEEVYRQEISLSEFGTAGDTFEVKPFFPLGTYTLKMESGTMTASTTFEVQEFQAPRHFVEILFKRETKRDESYINLNKEIDLLTCNVAGKYYAGGPVKHGKVRWKTYYTRTNFIQKAYPDYVFGNEYERGNELVESGESILDEKGQLKVTFPVSKDVASGLYGVEVVATVLDFDGRASTETKVYQEEPAYLIGISSHERSIQAGNSQMLKIIAVPKNGVAVETGKINVEVMRGEGIYVRKRNEAGDVYWEYKEVFRKQLSTVLNIEHQKALFDFDFMMGGRYTLRFTYKTPDEREYASSTLYEVQGYFYGYEYENQNRTFERFSVFPEKKEYSPGETIRVFLNPHKRLSTILMTVERKGILQHRTFTLTPDRNSSISALKRTLSPTSIFHF